MSGRRWNNKSRYSSILILYSLIIPVTTVSSFARDKSLQPVELRRCLKPVPIQIPECQNTFYNFTGMPNLVEQETQFEARHQLQTFKPLIAYKCSSKLSFFLCSVYTPMCDVITRHLIGPCRPLCEHVKARCAPVLRVFDFEWPAHLNCSRFPIKNVVGGTMCMEGPEDSEESPIMPDSLDPREGQQSTLAIAKLNLLSTEVKLGNVEQRGPLDKRNNMYETSIDINPELEESFVNKWIQQFTKLQLPEELKTESIESASTYATKTAAISMLARSLRHCAHLKKPTFYVYNNRTGRCVPLCRADILFNPDAKRLTTIWTSLLTGICSLVTIVTLIGYVYDSNIVLLSERPVVYIAVCQLFYALGFAISLASGREAVTCGRDSDSGREIRLQEGLDNSSCALVFMIQYFFSIASSIWWILLALHWVLYHNMDWRSVCVVLRRQPKDQSHGKWTVENDCWTNVCEGICVYCLPTDDPWMHELYWKRKSTSTRSRVIPDKSFIPPLPQSTDSVTKYDPTIVQTSTILPNPTGQCSDVSVPHSAQSVLSTAMVSYYVQNGKVVPSTRYTGALASSPESQRTERLSSSNNNNKYSVCLTREHIIVWLTAGLLTVGVLVSRQVDADELVPICGVGRQHLQAMGTFVIGPELCLAIGGLLIMGVGIFMCICDKRNSQTLLTVDSDVCVRSCDLPCSDNSQLLRQSPITQNGGSDHKRIPVSKCHPHNCKQPLRSLPGTQSTRHLSGSETTRMRLGLFNVLYLIPLLCVISCDLYEYLYRDSWLQDPNYKATEPTPIFSFPPKLWKPNEVVGPSPELFMLRIFMSLVPGFTCSLWMWSAKGCGPWNHLCISLWSSLRSWRVAQLLVGKSSKTSVQKHTSNKVYFNFPPVDSQPSKPRSHLIEPKGQTSFLLSPHPYAIYQYQSAHTPTNGQWHIDSAGAEEFKTAIHHFDPCVIVTTGSVLATETQHSNATTPGYYSQAKVSSNIEPSLSDTFSDESAIPPPVPATSRPALPSRGDPCIGASTTHVSVLTIQSGQNVSAANITGTWQ